MVSEQSSARGARRTLWLMLAAVAVAVVATLWLARGGAATADPRPSAHAQLQNRGELFPPPPLPNDGESYVYTPSADGDVALNPREADGSDAPSGADRHTAPDPSRGPGAFVIPHTHRQETTRSTAGTLSRGAVVFTQRPTARRIFELYPQRPLRQGHSGRVMLDCTVLATLALDCAVAVETPRGEGFGRAALAAAQTYRARPTLSNGTSAVGTRTRVVMSFIAPQ